MDVVYIYKRNDDGNDLRYSLRGLSNLNLDIGKVWIIGDLPVWAKNLNHIPDKDTFTHKNQNAIKKIITACRNEEISEDFLLMNDDFYFLKKTSEIPNYARESLKKTLDYYAKRYGNSKYVYSMKNTLKEIGDNGIDFEIHFPILINKKKFLEIINQYPWKRKPYVYRSLYGNKLNLTPTNTRDFKIYNHLQLSKLKGNEFFISSDNSISRTSSFKLFLKRKLPKKSVYEK